MAHIRSPQLAIACAVCLTLSLQGCGGGGGSPTPAPTPAPPPTAAPTAPAPTPAPTPVPPDTTTTVTTTTTTTFHPRTKPMSSAAMAAYLNQQYMGFDENNPNSPLGLSISMASQPDSFYKNIYCSVIHNPVLNTTGCNLGRTDCRMSASLYNHKMLVSSKTGSPLMGLTRPVGILFNQTLVENQWSRCSYIWDGASDRKYNVGCGMGCPGSDCKKPPTAFDNICPSTGKICTAKDKESMADICTGFMGGTTPIPPTHNGHTQCAFPGPAIDYHLQDDWKPGTSNLRDMAQNRAKFSAGSDSEGPNLEKWNEIVIDERLMLPLIDYDPAVAIPAFIYVKGNGKEMAVKMRDEFCKLNKVDPIPLVAVDQATAAKNPNGPFSADSEDVDEGSISV